MLSKNIKRWLLLLLAVSMLFSLLPVFALAAEEENLSDAGTSAATEIAPLTVDDQPQTDAGNGVSTEVNPLIAEYQGEMDRIMTDCLGAVDLTPEEIQAKVDELDDGLCLEALWEIMVLEEEMTAALEADSVTAADIEGLIAENSTFVTFVDIVTPKAEVARAGMSLFTTLSVQDGAISITDTANTATLSNGTLTATAKGGLLSKATNTITVINNSGSTATISFSYSVTSANSFTIDSASAATSGGYSKLLGAGESITIFIKSNSGFSNLTVTLKLSNITLTAAADSSNVTVNFDSALGSVTAGGSAIASGTSQEVSLADGVALAATANSGVKFLGWIDEADGTILSTAASFTLTPAADMTVQAVFAKDGGKLWFAVGGSTQQSVSSGLLGLGRIYYFTASRTYLFDDLNAAATAAAASSANKVVTLANSGTLPAGNYTIPAGVTLLIPFDDANSLYTTQALNTGTYTKPTEYRTLTMADGAKLTINGVMSLSAKQRYAQGSKADGGSPTGPVSFVRMNGNSSITVNNGGALYAWGFITGSGTVTANSGAIVYEMFQIMDFRGGTQSTDMENGVFPLSQYYVQNIEVPLTLHSGAKEYAYTTVYMSSADFGTAIGFISNKDAMFNLTSGYVVKKYDGTTDRLLIEVHGDMTVSTLKMQVGTSSINSEEYELAINNNITVKVCSGSEITINQDLALLPGTELILEEGAACTLGSGCNVYIYDADQWGNYTFGASSKNTKFKALTYAPGRTYTRTDADMVDAKIVVNGTVDASAGCIYTTAGGANICSDGTGEIKTTAGTQTVTYQLEQSVKYHEIPITPAKLKNADGTYITSGTDTYTYTDGEWLDYCGVNGHTAGDAATCTTAQTCTRCGTTLKEALGHTEVVDAAVAATCTATGLTEGKHCSVCNTVTVAQTEVAALGHTGDAATCTTPYICTRCGVTVQAALGHTEVVDAAVAPTCTATGLTEGKHCSVCNEVLVAQEEVAANGHRYESVTVDPTCFEDGSTTYTCATCDDSYSEVIASQGHNEVSDEAVEATCTATGLTAGSHCDLCGEVIVAQEVIAALGHKDENADKVCDNSCGTALEYGIDYSMQAFLTLENEVYMKVGFKVAEASTVNTTKDGEKIPSVIKGLNANVGLLVWDPATYGKGTEVTHEFENVTDYKGAYWNDEMSRYEVSTAGIPAKELGDQLSFRAYFVDMDGNYVYSRLIEDYSPKTYCYNRLKADIPAEETAKAERLSENALMVAILNYGTAAQKYFDYKIDTPMNGDLTDEQKAYGKNWETDWDSSLIRDDWNYPADEAFTRSSVVTSRGGYLSLLGAIDYNYYIKVDPTKAGEGLEVTSIEMLYWKEADLIEKEIATLTEENKSGVMTEWTWNNRYEFKFKGLAAKEMFEAIYTCAKITFSDGSVHYGGVLAYSPERFAAVHENSATLKNKELARTMAFYGDAARSYFAQKNS